MYAFELSTHVINGGFVLGVTDGYPILIEVTPNAIVKSSSFIATTEHDKG